MNPRLLRQQAALTRAREAAGGVQLSSHAWARARELGFHEIEVLSCIAAPETVYPGGPGHQPGRLVYRRGECACVVDTHSSTVVTVLLRTHDQWRHGLDTRMTKPRMTFHG